MAAMGRTRRIGAVLVLAVALLGAAALAPPPAADIAAGPVPHGHDAAVQPAKAQPGLVPGARAVDEQMALVVMAILAAVVGVGPTRRRLSRRYRRRTALAAAHLHHLRLRGPPTLQRA